MKPIASMTIIRGKGEGVELIVNDIAQKEINKRNERLAKDLKFERENGRYVTAELHAQLKKKYEACRKETVGEKIVGFISYFITCYLLLFEHFGWVEYSYEKGKWQRKEYL